MSDKVKLKGHESFSIREGWLTKGLFEVKNNSKLFSRKDLNDLLGIGTNMVKSLKFWLQVSGLIEENKKNEYILSELGELIYKYDPYLEDIFSLYFIHINIVTNIERALIWNLFFNKCNINSFSKKDLQEQIQYILDSENLEYNEKILTDELSVLIKTYLIDESNDTPENNFSCPLSDLKLIKRLSKDNYSKEKSQMNNLNELVVYYLILNNSEKDDINIEDLIKKDNSVGKLLNLDKVLLNEYLDILKKQELITINRTAGLNMLYINKRMNIEEIFCKYFGKED